MKFFAVFTLALAAVANAAPAVDTTSTEVVAGNQLADHISCPILDCAKSLASNVSSCGKAVASLGRNVIADAQCLAAAVSTIANAVVSATATSTLCAGYDWGEIPFPMVVGHEITGVVRSVGKNVTKFKVGQNVGVGTLVNSCRTCENCKDGEEPYCLGNDKLPGYVATYNSKDPKADFTPTAGGYSQMIVVDQDFVLSIPDSMPLDKAAPLLCAGITMYSPLRFWNAGPGKRVAIIGLGGLGHVGVKIAKALGAEVTVLSQSLSKKELGLKLGADQYFATADAQTFETLKAHFDLILSTVSANLDFDQYLSLLRRNGSLVEVGLPEEPMKVHAFSLVLGRRSISGSSVGGLKETQEMLDFCAKHGITADIETISASYINEAWERVLKSDVRFRFVIDISTL